MYLLLKETTTGNFHEVTLAQGAGGRLSVTNVQVVSETTGPDWKANASLTPVEWIAPANPLPAVLGWNQVTQDIKLWKPTASGGYKDRDSAVIGALGTEWKLSVQPMLSGIFGHNQKTQEIGVWRLNGLNPLTTTTGLADARIGSEWDLMIASLRGVSYYPPPTPNILGWNGNTGELYAWYLKESSEGPKIYAENHVGTLGREWRRLQSNYLGGHTPPRLFGQSDSGDIRYWTTPDGDQFDTGIPLHRIDTQWKLAVINVYPDYQIFGQNADGDIHAWLCTFSEGILDDHHLYSAPGRVLIGASAYYSSLCEFV